MQRRRLIKRILMREEVANFCYKSYQEYRAAKARPDAAIESIRSKVADRFGEDYSFSKIQLYSLRPFEEAEKWRRKYALDRVQSWREKEKERIAENPDYFEFLESAKKFKEQQPVAPPSLDNPYVKTLMMLNEHDYGLNSKKIAQIQGKGVSKELKICSMCGFIDHPSSSKTTISKKGIDYLKSIGAI